MKLVMLMITVVNDRYLNSQDSIPLVYFAFSKAFNFIIFFYSWAFLINVCLTYFLCIYG